MSVQKRKSSIKFIPVTVKCLLKFKNFPKTKTEIVNGGSKDTLYIADFLAAPAALYPHLRLGSELSQSVTKR